MKRISKFIRSLFNCVMNQNNAGIIGWGEGGFGFRIINKKDFRILLYNELKIRNLSTFIRQVNLYGFKTKRNIDNVKEYFHEHFVQNQKDKLNIIKRKCSKEANLQIINDYSIQSIKQENDLLYQELQKNKEQQLLMLKSIQINFDIQRKLQITIANWIQRFIQCHQSNEKEYYENVVSLFLNLSQGFKTENLNFLTEGFLEIYSNSSSANLSPLPFQKLSENTNYNLNS